MKYDLLMKFVDESQSFTNGFECGQIWERMENNKEFINYLFHNKNKSQVEMMCRRFGYEYIINDFGSGWGLLTGKVSPTKNN